MTLIFLFFIFLAIKGSFEHDLKRRVQDLFTYLHAVKCTHLECMVLSFHTDVNYHLYQEIGHFHHPRKFLSVALKFSPQPLPQAATDRSLSLAVGFSCSRIFHKRSHKVRALLCLSPFGQQVTFGIYPVVYTSSLFLLQKILCGSSSDHLEKSLPTIFLKVRGNTGLAFYL